jgi:hypothetical protein
VCPTAGDEAVGSPDQHFQVQDGRAALPHQETSSAKGVQMHSDSPDLDLEDRVVLNCVTVSRMSAGAPLAEAVLLAAVAWHAMVDVPTGGDSAQLTNNLRN